MKHGLGMMVLVLALALVGCGGGEDASCKCSSSAPSATAGKAPAPKAATSKREVGKPHFSWDRVPVSAHLGLGDGLTAKQTKFIAEHYNFITFTGGRMSKEYRADPKIHFEGLITTAAKEIKAINPKVRVLYYVTGNTPRAQNKLANAAYPKGATIRIKRNATRTDNIFDLTRKDVRDWWVNQAADAVHKYGCDGIYLDGGTAYTPGGPYERFLGKKKNAEMEKHMFAMLKAAKAKMGKDSMILVNPLHGPKKGQKQEESLGWRYLDYIDGAMIDDFDRGANIVKRRQSAEYIVATIKTMTAAAKRGEIVIFKAWPGFTWWSDPGLMKKSHAEQHAVAKKNIEFQLACFLIGAEKHCYFCYTWGWLGEYGTYDWYPEFDKPLGAPKGDAVQTGMTFKREFKHASVFVDVEKRIGKIDWKKK